MFRLRGIAYVGACITMLGLSAPAASIAASAAAATPTPTTLYGSGNTPLLTVGSDGTITYNNSIGVASAIGATNITNSARTGHLVAGSCIMGGENPVGVMAPGSAPFLQIELSFNPNTCTQVLQTSRVSAAGLQALAAVDAQNDQIASASQSSQEVLADASNYQQRLAAYLAANPTAPPAGASTSGLSASSGPLSAASPNCRTAPNPWAYVESTYYDPLDITITEQANTLTWYSNAESCGALGFKSTYDFPYDGWSIPNQYGPDTAAYSNVNGHSWAYMNYDYTQFENTDFEHFMLAVGGVLTLASCKFNTSPAYFQHADEVYGYGDGSMSPYFSDSVTGGCSNLVSYSSQGGYAGGEVIAG